MPPLKGSEYTLAACEKTLRLDSELGLKLMEMLGGTTWAKGMSHEDVKEFISYLSLYEFKNGASIFGEGDSECYMGLMMTGRIEITKRNEASHPMPIQLAVVEPGQVFGEMAMLDGQPRSASAIAKGDVLMAVLLVEQYRNLCAGNPALALKLTRNIAMCMSLRLRKTSDNLVRYL